MKMTEQGMQSLGFKKKAAWYHPTYKKLVYPNLPEGGKLFQDIFMQGKKEGINEQIERIQRSIGLR